jgi:hypothetical protein
VLPPLPQRLLLLALPRRWQQSHCRYGPDCKYAHGEHELREMSADAVALQQRLFAQKQASAGRWGRAAAGRGRGRGGSGGSASSSALLICWRRPRPAPHGACTSYASCTLRLRPPPLPPAAGGGQQGPPRPDQGAPRQRYGICDHFVKTGTCPYGERCRFAHDPSMVGSGPRAPHPRPGGILAPGPHMPGEGPMGGGGGGVMRPGMQMGGDDFAPGRLGSCRWLLGQRRRCQAE